MHLPILIASLKTKLLNVRWRERPKRENSCRGHVKTIIFHSCNSHYALRTTNSAESESKKMSLESLVRSLFN